MAQTTVAPGSLHAGAAQVDITPQAGVHLAGAVGMHRPARLVLDPLYATALVLEAGGRKLCFLALDVTIITEDYTALIRQRAAEETGIEPDALMVHATQTHSAPPLGHFMVDPDFLDLPPELEWIRGGDEAYSDQAAECAVEAICRANDALQPVQIGVASGIEGRFAFNRRAVTRDGTIRMPGGWEEPLGPTWLRYLEGPIDPELGVLCLRTDSLDIVSVLANYTCHPVHAYPKRAVSSDWPGALVAELRQAYGADCVPIVLNGACGNINPWPPFDPDYVRDHRRMGRALAEVVGKVIETLEFTDRAALDWRVRHLPIPIRELEPEELAWAQAILEEHPEPQWADEERVQVDRDWMAAASVYSVHLMRQRSETLDYEIQVLRVGDTAFVGLPGEPFVELGLAIKLASPTYPTYIAHCTSHYVGYIPFAEALERGGHEAQTRYWAKLVPEAFDMIVAAANELLDKMFDN